MFLLGAFAVALVAMSPIIGTDMYVNELGPFAPETQAQSVQPDNQQVSMTHIEMKNEG